MQSQRRVQCPETANISYSTQLAQSTGHGTLNLRVVLNLLITPSNTRMAQNLMLFIINAFL